MSASIIEDGVEALTRSGLLQAKILFQLSYCSRLSLLLLNGTVCAAACFDVHGCNSFIDCSNLLLIHSLIFETDLLHHRIFVLNLIFPYLRQYVQFLFFNIVLLLPHLVHQIIFLSLHIGDPTFL